MEQLLTISEAAELSGFSEYILRRMDDEGSFPAIKSEGGHRRYQREAVLRLKHKNSSKDYSFDVVLRRIPIEKLTEGTDSFIPDPWKERHFHVGLVKASEWELGDHDRYMYFFPAYPKVTAYASLGRKPLNILDDRNVQFSVTEKLNSPQKFINLRSDGWCDAVYGPPDREVHRWYYLPLGYVEMAFVWSYGHRSLQGDHLPGSIFLVVKDDAFKEETNGIS